MYKISYKLGQGAFGIVYHMQINNGSEVALKVVEIDRFKSHEMDPATEARLMLKLSHAHLVQCCASCIHGRYIYLVMELCPHGTLKSYLNGRTKLVREAHVLTWLGQMADVLRYLHACRVIHRDLKTENVFLDKRRNVKVGDLGIARELDYTAQRAGTFIGTFCYMSPEILQSSTYSYETDIWSLGCCIHEVMTLHQTFAAQSMMNVMDNIMEARIPPIPDMYCKKLQNLVLSMLDREASRRPDGLDILFTVSKIQGYPFKCGPHKPKENMNIDQRLLYKAVQDFETKFPDGIDNTLHIDVAAINTRKEEAKAAVESEKDRDIDVPKEQCFKAKRQRPLPHPRHINQDVQVGSEIKVTAKYKTHKQGNSNTTGKNKLPLEQSQQNEHETQTHQYSTNKRHLPSQPSSVCESNFASSSSCSSSSSSSSSDNTSLYSTQECMLQTDDPATDSDHGDSGVSISRYIDCLAKESQQWLRLKFGLSEDRNPDHIGDDDGDTDSDNPVTLYTHAQVAKYNNRKAKPRKVNTGHVT